jgi:hypothetical protein
MNKISSDDYSKRLNKHIKDEFKKVLKLTHPCEDQNRNCFNGSECPLIGLPNDTCPHYIRGTCKFDPCRYKHYDLYAKVYRKAKEDFKKEERQPLIMIRRNVERFLPYLMWFIGLIFSYVIRKALDSVGKKVTFI